MKSHFLILVLIFCSTITFAQFEGSKQIFESPNLTNEVALHKTVAIIPFTTKITYRKQPKNFNSEANHEQEIAMSKSIQNSLYTFLLRKSKNYTVSFQDVNKTNILLKKAGMSDKLDEFTYDEIAKALEVDGVLGGLFESEQSKSEGAALASAIMFGGVGGKTGTGSLTLTIYNGKDGELLYRFFKTMDDNITSSTDDLVERMMRKISRQFPYEKEKEK